MALTPTPVRTLQHYLEEAIFVGQAHRLGVFKELHKKPDTSQGLAQRMHFDLRATWILLEALVELGYLEKNNGTYAPTEYCISHLVDENGNEYEGDFLQFLLYLINPWKTLSHVLRTGTPDESSFKELSMRDFIKGMDSPWKKRLAPEIVDLCIAQCSDPRTCIDIGGAPGTIAKEFAKRGITTIVFDLPQSLEITQAELKTIPNIEIIAGDATVALPNTRVDIAFLGNLCHGQSPEDNQKIINMCFDILNSNGIIVIFDNLRDESYLGATLALHMLTQSKKGNIYSREEYFLWLDKAGFKSPRVYQLSDRAWQLVIAKK
ncbi:MAG: acetylserotonin O-methyltransferase [Spirochaetes bacterium]|nr:acetylserotonin O-methyltransferase [Spirochaetota bacterium]